MKAEKRGMYLGESAKMLELMEETKIKDPDHMCAGAFMTWGMEYWA